MVSRILVAKRFSSVNDIVTEDEHTQHLKLSTIHCRHNDAIARKKSSV